MLRSILAVIAGLATMLLLVGFGRMLVAGIMLAPVPAGTMPQLPSAFFMVSLVLNFVAAIMGGWLTGRLAERDPLLHAGALSILFLLISLLSIIGGGQAQQQISALLPKWYPWVVIVTGAGGVLLGGILRGGRRNA